MPTPAPQPDPRRQSNIVVLLVITAALIGGGVLMWASGLFEHMGRAAAIVVLAVDVVVLAALWSVLVRRDLNRRQ